MSKVFVKYGFIFDPDDAWNNLTDFEIDLALMMKQRGLKAELVESVAEQEDMVVIYISKSDQINLTVDTSREKVINGKPTS
jgi:hypothetical protein